MFDPVLTIGWAFKLLEEFHRLHPQLKKSRRRDPAYWRCPPSGRLKVNVDGAFNSEDGVGGIGVVARNELGEYVAALVRHFCGFSRSYGGRGM